MLFSVVSFSVRGNEVLPKLTGPLCEDLALLNLTTADLYRSITEFESFISHTAHTCKISVKHTSIMMMKYWLEE